MANILQASIRIKAGQPAYHQIANTIADPTQLESLQKRLGLIFNDFPKLKYY
jgi:hypothetical protein